MRTFTLFWILLAAAPLMAQEPNGVALPENPGGVDMRLPDSVRGRLEEAQKERAALEQADPPASPNLVSLVNRQIEQLERHLALLDFELLPWVGDPADRPRIMSDLCFALHAALLRHGIEIPFPQRDLHLRSAEPLRMDRGDPVERSDPPPE